MKLNLEGLPPIQGEVIVIEDDATLRSLMKDIVAELGASAVVFETADDALTYLLQAHGQCRLVIADHGVPGQIQGTEFIEMIKGRWPSISAILTSGYLIDPATIPATAIYLHKPWSMDDLLSAISFLLQPDSTIPKP
ncbi:response regulator [Pseudomonas fluorescens]|uniref:Response regulator n=1 Tax=Pseudomonas fluorescens TaxID=294 RepID=A0A448DYR4_PSEFL|nr:response regulator [Pseudomonas fluorescens]VEF11926.1 response regulator [Pseudomonas fluorescens]